MKEGFSKEEEGGCKRRTEVKEEAYVGGFGEGEQFRGLW